MWGIDYSSLLLVNLLANRIVRCISSSVCSISGAVLPGKACELPASFLVFISLAVNERFFHHSKLTRLVHFELYIYACVHTCV